MKGVTEIDRAESRLWLQEVVARAFARVCVMMLNTGSSWAFERAGELVNEQLGYQFPYVIEVNLKMKNDDRDIRHRGW